MSLTSYRTAPPRDTLVGLPPIRLLEAGSCSFHRVREVLWAFARFGGDLLSRGLSPSTIGAAVLNFRVRYGTGCFTCAMTTKPRKSPCRDFAEQSATRGRQRLLFTKGALPLGCYVNQHRALCAAECHEREAAYSRRECAFPQLSCPWSRSVYAFGLV